MFTIGLEISLKNLLSMKKVVLIGGGLQLCLTTAAVWAIMVMMGFSSNTAIFIGFLVAHSSTAVIMNLYQQSGEIDTHQGKMALGLLIFQDLNVVPMILMVPILAGSSSESLGWDLLNFGFGMILLGLILVAAIIFVPRILTKIVSMRNQELFVITIVVICFGIAWLMSLNGVSLALGAFLAGVAISESEYSYEIIGQVMPIRDILTSFFFVSIGMMLNLSDLTSHLLVIVAIAAALLFGKTIINFVSLKAIGVASTVAFLSAVGLSQIGEFSFILGVSGLQSGILTEEVYQIFLAISIVTMAATPYIVKAAPVIADKYIKTHESPQSAETARGSPSANSASSPTASVSTEKADTVPAADTSAAETLEAETSDISSKKESRHVVVVGYGICGQYVVKALKNTGLQYVIIELNPGTVTEEKKKGEEIIYGDASRDIILNHVKIGKAGSIVVTIPNTEATKAIITTVRRLNPTIYIIARARFVSDIAELYRLGADKVIVDERETALEIFKCIILKGKTEFVLGTDVQLNKDYQINTLRLAQQITLNRATRSMDEVGRNMDAPHVSQMVYPIMQMVDIHTLGVDLALGGIDQRKIHMLAREYLPTIGAKAPLCMHTPIINGLNGKKMSSSEGNYISVADTEEDIRKKMKKAFCAFKFIHYL